MKVLHLLSSTGFHGAESMTAELVRQLHALGVDIHVAAFDAGDGGNTEILQAVNGHAQGVARIPCNGPLDHRAFRQLNAYIREHGIDLVHSHKYKTTFYAIPGRWLRRFKLVTTYHNWLTHTPALKFYASLDKQLARFNDAAVAVSTPVAEELRRHMPSRRVHQIDNGIDIQRYARQMSRQEAKAQLGLDPNRPALGFVGRLSPEKGLGFLIQALQQRSQELGGVQTLIVGAGEEQHTLEAQLKQAGLQDRVQLLGNRRDTPLIYSALDAFVLPSLIEAFPMVLLEAMSCGCPVVATDVGEVHRIVQPGVTGLIVPPQDAAALGQALVDLLTAPDRADQMGQTAAQEAQKRFSAASMARQYLQVYQNCLG